MYKRTGHRVLLNKMGDLVVRPSYVETAIRGVPGGTGVLFLGLLLPMLLPVAAACAGRRHACAPNSTHCRCAHPLLCLRCPPCPCCPACRCLSEGSPPDPVPEGADGGGGGAVWEKVCERRQGRRAQHGAAEGCVCVRAGRQAVGAAASGVWVCRVCPAAAFVWDCEANVPTKPSPLPLL